MPSPLVSARFLRTARGRRRLIAPALVVVALLAACSDDDVGTPTTTSSTTTTTTTTTTTVAAAPASEDAVLDGTAWRLFDDSDVQVILTFGTTSIDAHDGVNTLSGEYEVDGSELTIRMGTPTDFPYPDDLPGPAVIERLATVERATVDGSRLVLVQRDGTSVTLDPAG